MTKRARRALALIAATLALQACGEEAGGAGPLDAAVSDGGCAPSAAPNWTPVWRPPRTTRDACTDAQIDAEFARCESTTGSTEDCKAFNRDPANAGCRSCLFATEDESSYGPLVYLKNRAVSVNVPGCLALADGNLSAAGCGARLQSFESCTHAACLETCVAYDAFQSCVTIAGNTVCQSYRDDSVCSDAATYALCLDNATFEDYFRTLSKLFCGAGFPGGGGPDGGNGTTDGGLHATDPWHWVAPLSSLRVIERSASQSLARWGTGAIDR